MRKIYEITEIASLKLLHLPTVLEEVFLAYPRHLDWEAGPEPKIVRDLAAMSLMPVQKVIQKLQVIVRENKDIEMTLDEIKNTSALNSDHLLLNVDRSEACPQILGLANVVNFFSQPFLEISKLLREAELTVTCSKDPSRAYSAAIELRRLGYKGIYCLR